MAIVRMGVNEVANIVARITHENNFRSKDPFLHTIMRRLWRHALGVAMAAHWLAKECGLQNLAHEAFFAGLLHDVGKLFILSVIDELKHTEKMDIPHVICRSAQGRSLRPNLIAKAKSNCAIFCFESDPTKFVRDDFGRLISSSQWMLLSCFSPSSIPTRT
jgi:hypothetical protein